MTTVQPITEPKAPTPNVVPPRVPPPRRTLRQRQELRDALIFLSPWIIGFILFTAGPIVASLVLSFCRWDVITPPKWVGLANYQQLFNDRLLVKSLTNTIVYAAMYIPSSIIAALALAMLLNQKLPGMRVFRTIFYLPSLTQGVATFTLWAVVFEPETGLLNRALAPVVVLLNHLPGVELALPRWLGDPNWSKPALVIMSVWSVGSMMLIFLAGLQNIPRQLYEAADIDGAGKVQQFFHVTLPMLSPTLFFNLIIVTIASFRVFESAFVMTQGGPSNSTLFYAYYLFVRAFSHFHMGYASAMAWLLFVIVLVLTMIQIRMGRKWVHYG